jgi:hypothetical protein
MGYAEIRIEELWSELKRASPGCSSCCSASGPGASPAGTGQQAGLFVPWLSSLVLQCLVPPPACHLTAR